MYAYLPLPALNTYTTQAALSREASDFVACEDRANAASDFSSRQPLTAKDLRNKHEHWWHSTVLAVAQMVSGTVDSDSNNPGRSARLQLGSAEVAAKLSSGYDDTDYQVRVSPIYVFVPGAA